MESRIRSNIRRIKRELNVKMGFKAVGFECEDGAAMGKTVLKWDEGFSVGVQEMDDQHKKLFDAINHVYTALHERNIHSSNGLLGGSLDEMAAYTKMHFEAEEKLMREHGYPGYEAHKNEHDHFTLTVMDFKRRYDGGDTTLTAEMLASLVTWLDTHLNGTDKLYTPFFSARKIT